MVVCVSETLRRRWCRCSGPVTLSGHRGHTTVTPTMTRLGWQPNPPARELRRGFWAYLVWSWHWAQPSELPLDKARRIELDDATARRKREAVQCFTSQLTGPEPILSASTVRRLTRDFEVFVAP